MSDRRDESVPADDAGVSAVIGVILMVAITVAIAATVYIWVGGFDTGDGGTEAASATAKAVSLDDNPRGEWIKITITDGDGPYTASEVGADVATGSDTFDTLCSGPNANQTASGGDPGCFDPYSGSDEWEVGQAKWFPCQSTDRHSVSIALRGTAVLDKSVDCSEQA